MNDLPRNMNLKAFDPHRADFVCRHEADAVPPIDPEAEQWLQQGLALTSPALWPEERDYGKALQLWQRAAERKHWKAMLNVANAYAEGDGVPKDTERAVQLVEAAMKLGIPAAYDVMGTYHMEGVGVKQDASRAYAFWELAADKGSPSAMAYLGAKMDADYDNPQRGFWGNRKVALKMLECAFAQGNGKAAHALGSTLAGTDASRGEDYARALKILHEGVKLGSAESASYLSFTFRVGKPMVGDVKDGARAERYGVLGDALELNPDLRLPNLDRVLPLPPTPLPKWDGNKQTLIDAAKAVVAVPVVPPGPGPSAGPQRSGRAHVPEGHALPEEPQRHVPAQFESTAAPESGYWIARLIRPVGERHLAWNAEQVPMRYARGELFDRTRPGLMPEDGRIQFHYLGELVALPVHAVPVGDPRVARRIAREAQLPEPARRCLGDRSCPATGIWQASVPGSHPMATTFNQWHRQAYVLQGRPFPHPGEAGLDIESGQVTWTWWNQANRESPVGIAHVGLGA
ncbi:hypothetical protein RT97_27840 [Variovorax paradoxus]|uniref:DUF6396 domain-containing protein n=1 Tax=Variovorax paradoxus TaxID=34073 RepID=A0A0D0LTH8_VARPD|nr:tetratricopeptide repeat protein [Variovorax paradoxus]KIQ20855.1 hypothetical protein RT97_27840 [Variovorax paradoxus]